MAPVQTRIEFNIRKKRSTAANWSKLTHEKENEGSCDVKILTPKSNTRNSSKFLSKKNIENETDSVEDKRKSYLRNQSIGRKKRSQIFPDSDSSDTENSSSPPKRERSSDESPSHSPSVLLNKLRIHSPALRQVKENDTIEKHLTPKKLFDAVSNSNYRQARRALHSTAPNQMHGREEELQHLQGFLMDCLDSRRSGTLYVSGPPGTGKTACLTKTLKESKFQEEYKSILINCTSMKSSGNIFARICEELKLKVTGKTEKHYLTTIEKFFTTNMKMTLLVLDEIDQLDSKRQAVLYTIFEWPSKPNSKLVLIGIANALDLTDRVLPRLQARLDLKPELMHFAPYSKQQIVHILSQRLKELDASDIFSPVALQLLAGKVAAVSGDVRRALDIGRRVLELAEVQQLPSRPLQPTTDHVSNTSSPKKLNSSQSVDLKVVMDVLNSVYGTSQSLGRSGSSSSSSYGDDSFPLQQKVMVCTLLLMIKKGHSKDVSVGKLHDVYRRVCMKRNLLAVDQAEFLSLCQLVETRGIVRVQPRKEARLAKVSLQWDEEEVASALKDKQLLAAILNDTSCLSR